MTARRGGTATGRWREQTGAVAGVEAIAFGVLIFVLGTLVVANVWAAIDGRGAADGAARAAVRDVVRAEPGADLQRIARQAATAGLVAHGVDPQRLRSVAVDGTLVRCGVVSVTVAHEVPLAIVPPLGANRPSITVRSTHAAVVDPYRSGLPATPGVPCD
ncbi:hypothetical protein FTX61_05430 [Nitriliruptoraceae bacterium ZYF776]|nr:hypothetical protein [Profundirhabdus halotolerans]